MLYHLPDYNALNKTCFYAKIKNIFFLYLFPDYKAFLLYSKVVGLESLHMFDFDSKNAPHEPISNATYMKNVIGLSYDYKNKIIYFSDIQKANIQAVSFDGKNYSVIVEKGGASKVF